MKRDLNTVKKHSGKIVLPPIVGAGVPKSALPLKDTEYYQVGPNGDYVQECK